MGGHEKGGLGQFADWRGGLGEKERVMFLRVVDTPMDTMPLQWTNCREIQVIMKLKTFFILETGLSN